MTKNNHLIDDFIPRTVDSRWPINVEKTKRSALGRKFLSLHPRKSLDGMAVRPQRNHPNSVTAHAQQAAAPPKPIRRPSSVIPDKDVVMRVSKGHSVRAKLSTIIQYIALAAIALSAAYSTGIGQWFVLAYAIFVLVFRRSSQVTFAIALFLLVAVPIFQLLNQPGVANNMAVYVYELLVVGTVQAIIELRWAPKGTKQIPAQHR